MYPRQSHIIDHLKEASISHKDSKIIWNDSLEDSFKGLNYMVYDDNLLSYPYWTIPFTVHTNASDKQSFDVISQNNKPIVLYSRIISEPQRNYTMTKKELLAIVECLK